MNYWRLPMQFALAWVTAVFITLSFICYYLGLRLSPGWLGVLHLLICLVAAFLRFARRRNQGFTAVDGVGLRWHGGRCDPLPRRHRHRRGPGLPKCNRVHRFSLRDGRRCRPTASSGPGRHKIAQMGRQEHSGQEGFAAVPLRNVYHGLRPAPDLVAGFGGPE